MSPRQGSNLACVCRRQRQAFERFFREFELEVPGQPQFPQAFFQPNLPKADRAYEHGVFGIANQGEGLFRERRTIRQPPENQVRIE